MCLGIPGKIVSIEGQDEISKTAKVSFAGVIKEVSLACLSEAKVNDYIVVHAGFAISVIDQKQADEVFKYVKDLEEDLK